MAMRFNLLVMLICCSAASLPAQADPPHYVIKSDGTVYDCSTAPTTPPRYIIKSDGVIYDTLTGTEIEPEGGAEDSGD